MSKMLNFDFLENEKSFWGEIKNILPSFTSSVNINIYFLKRG